MRINPNFDRTMVTGTQASQAAAPKSPVVADAGLPSGPQKLLQAVKELPLVRADRVARARELVNDPAYPSDAVLGKVSDVLAANIKASDSAS